MKKAKLTIVLSLLFSFIGYGQIMLRTIDSQKLPAGVKYDGKITSSYGWTDSLGDHIVILTETGIVSNKTEIDFNDAYLYAYHYLVQNDSAKLIWRIYDFIKECNVDIEANFIKNTFMVTDLNKDGTSEIWVMYRTGCYGGVDPIDMKIIMYQGIQKYAMRGKNKVQISDKEFAGGEFTFDPAFKEGAKEFQDFALALWNKNLLYQWE